MTIHLLTIIKNQWRYWLTAVQFFTRIPINIKDFNPEDLNKSTRYFPLIGILVGSASALVFILFDQVLPLSLAVLTSMAATLMLTGGFHEDGLADAADGLGGGWKKEQVLKIMVDSRIGTYGALALVMALLTKYHALVEQSASFIPLSLIAGHALSRFCAVLVMVKQDYVKPDGKAKPLATKINRHELAIAALFGLAPLSLLMPFQWFAIIPVIFIWGWFSHKINTRIGGYTGDCLGAMQQLTEITFYIGLLMTQELNIVFNL